LLSNSIGGSHLSTVTKYVQDNIIRRVQIPVSGFRRLPSRGGIVPYSAEHRVAKREQIVDSARHLFNRHGFDRVSVKQIMAGAGLTHGGFYSYFETKSDLYTEVLRCFFTDPNWKSRWKGLEVDLCSKEAGPQIVRAYLSPQHLRDVENSCPMVALPTEVRRSDPRVRSAFETVFQAMVSALEKKTHTKRQRNGTPNHRRAQAIAALCIGGMVVARAMNEGPATDELREACMTVALELGNWTNGSSKKSRGKSSRTRQKASWRLRD
jgi:AcrR family transcriptional regulator